MELNHDSCYRALRTRDSRFDGRFYTGVRTTGIYCRPICPARTPKQTNVDFYACAAAAEDAGFRPCRRCRPETAPGTPAWLGTSTTVTRALRLISEGALDHDGDIDRLADRLGVTARHLRRLFHEHLGASPVAIAQARRVHFAKTLLDSTGMPITELAFSSGFSSVRRFNSVFAKTFRRSPRETRERGTWVARSGSPQSLELRLSYREPFDYEALLSFLAARAIPGVESVRDGRYQRTVLIETDSGVIEVWKDAAGSRLVLRIPPSLSRHAFTIAEGVRRVFDLSADSRVIESQLGSDPLMRDLVKRFSGTRMPGAWDPFEVSVRAILGQQVSVKGATTLSGRLAQTYGVKLESESEEGSCSWLHPSPEKLIRIRGERIGLTRARAAALRALSHAVVEKQVCFDAAVDLDHVVASLQEVQGIGPWTAQYVAMRSFGEPDAFPSGDLVLRRVAQRLEPSLDSERKLLEYSDAWRPWRAYAAMFLWRAHVPEIRASQPAKSRARKRRTKL
jgi:AraC family transcriptional regulator of adaptative response / DNA-3-methyladenine glycosylase II